MEENKGHNMAHNKPEVLLYKRSLSNGTVVTVCKDNSHDSADMDKLLRMLNFVEINSNHETEGSIGNTIKVAMIKNPIDRLIYHYRNKYQESPSNLGQNFSQFVTRLIDEKSIPMEPYWKLCRLCEGDTEIPKLIIGLEKPTVLKELVFMLRSSGIYEEMNRAKRRVFPRLVASPNASESNERETFMSQLTSLQVERLNRLLKSMDYFFFAM